MNILRQTSNLQLSLLGLISFVVRVLQLGVAATAHVDVVLSIQLFLVACNNHKCGLICAVSTHEAHITVLNDSCPFFKG